MSGNYNHAAGIGAVPANNEVKQGDRLTLALTVASNGEKLPPMAIYQAEPNVRVAREFSRVNNPYPQGIHYMCNRSAWMIEPAMLEWIDLVIVSYAEAMGHNNICMNLESFSVHRAIAVCERLSRLSIETIYIPGGLTKDLQPLDIGVNAPFKHWLENAFEETQMQQTQNASERRHKMVRCVHQA